MLVKQVTYDYDRATLGWASWIDVAKQQREMERSKDNFMLSTS